MDRQGNAGGRRCSFLSRLGHVVDLRWRMRMGTSRVASLESQLITMYSSAVSPAEEPLSTACPQLCPGAGCRPMCPLHGPGFSPRRAPVSLPRRGPQRWQPWLLRAITVVRAATGLPY